MTTTRLTKLISGIKAGKLINRREAASLLSARVDFWELLHGAQQIRTHFKGNRIGLCSIINAKSGNCAEDCAFCAQSAHHTADVKHYPLVAQMEIKEGYRRAQAIGAHGFSVVTSGNDLSEEEIESLCQSARKVTSNSRSRPYLCGSLGRLALPQIKKLKAAGFRKFHHNLETSRRYFREICTSHTYDERLATVRNIKTAGVRVCSGGIFGLGENWTDRLDLAFTLRNLRVDSVPLNFLIPVKGTTLATAASLTPRDILKIIALFRYILPTTDIRICAGREYHLRDLQSWIFYAGANGMMIGGYLTQPGRSVEADLRMLQDLGLDYVVE